MNLFRVKISKRMHLFISLALPQLPFWDICCDHGHAGIGAAYTENFTEIHLCDRLPHVMKNLEEFVYRLGPEYKQTPYYFHTDSGENLNCDVEGSCLIAGVGGLTIKNIIIGLQRNNRLKAQRLILCPHTDEVELVSLIEDDSFKKEYELLERRMIQVGKKLKPLFILNLKV